MALLAIVIGGAAGEALAQGGGRPVPKLLPEAHADAIVAEAGKSVRIDVLANDIGVPEAGDVEIRIEGALPACADVKIEGRMLVFRGAAACVGQDVGFGYSVKLDGNWLTAPVTVSLKPSVAGPIVSCNVPNTDWQSTKIEGGTFEKSAAPAGIADFVDLIDEASFTVDPFCITLESVPAEPVDRYFNNLPEEERRNQFPEIGVQNNLPVPQAVPGRLPASASQRMAVAFAKRTGERSDRQLMLPTLKEYVAAAWELQSRHRGAPQTDAFLITMRGGTLQWTSTPCGTAGSYWTIGPSTQASAQGKLVKLCYELSRTDRTGFRLVIK